MSPEGLNVIVAISIIVLFVWFWDKKSPMEAYKKSGRWFNFYFRHLINRYFIFTNICPKNKEILAGAFYYYQSLTPENQRLFEKRVQKFINQKKFIPAGEHDEVTPLMKTLIAASAVQITFGLPGVYLQNFEEIYVYPDFYFSEGMQQFNAGEVHKSGKIFLSWKDFVEGYTDPDNGRNLGLHEMAHALRLENMIQNSEFGYLDWNDLQSFNNHTLIESDKIRRGEASLFRAYAATHYQEFFAVLIEVFFEQPRQLLAYNADLFHVTSRLLRQNPIDPNRRVA